MPSKLAHLEIDGLIGTDNAFLSLHALVVIVLYFSTTTTTFFLWRRRRRFDVMFDFNLIIIAK